MQMTLMSPSTRIAIEILDLCLRSVEDCMKADKLKLNPDQTGPLGQEVGNAGFGSATCSKGGSIFSAGTSSQLGSFLDSFLHLDAQPVVVASCILTWIFQTSSLSLVHSLVPLRLNYCNNCYTSLPLKVVQKPQVVQNVAARMGKAVSTCTGC